MHVPSLRSCASRSEACICPCAAFSLLSVEAEVMASPVRIETALHEPRKNKIVSEHRME